MGRYFFKAPYKRDAYVLLRMESKKFVTTKDNRFIVTAEPLALNEYYMAFYSEVPFKAYVEDKVEIVLPDDLENVVAMADEVRRGRGRISMTWSTRDRGDFMASEEVEIRGNFSRRGLAVVTVRGHAKVEDPYICDDPDDCMRPLSILTMLYELANKYKVLEYRGASTISLIVKLFSDPKKEFSYISVYGVDASEVERLLKKEGFEVKNLCRQAEKELRIEKASEEFLIDC
jgi:hypothetical protein